MQYKNSPVDAHRFMTKNLFKESGRLEPPLPSLWRRVARPIEAMASTIASKPFHRKSPIAMWECRTKSRKPCRPFENNKSAATRCLRHTRNRMTYRYSLATKRRSHTIRPHGTSASPGQYRVQALYIDMQLTIHVLLGKVTILRIVKTLVQPSIPNPSSRYDIHLRQRGKAKTKKLTFNADTFSRIPCCESSICCGQSPRVFLPP